MVSNADLTVIKTLKDSNINSMLKLTKKFSSLDFELTIDDDGVKCGVRFNNVYFWFNQLDTNDWLFTHSYNWVNGNTVKTYKEELKFDKLLVELKEEVNTKL